MRGFGLTSYNKPIKDFKNLAQDVNVFMEETFPGMK